jgi:hypothetical protein
MPQVVVAHFENSERHLTELAKIPAITGHTLHKGTPREAFIRDFLGGHLGENLGIGTGEIIDSKSDIGAMRHQHDIIIYDNSFPRIYIGGGISAFLVESVVATIEIKSILDEDGILQAVKAGKETKALKSDATVRRRPIASYVLAYTGPAKMVTAFNWIVKAYTAESLIDPEFDIGQVRVFQKSAALDGVFVLGTGTCIFENNIGFAGAYPQGYSDVTWSIMDSDSGSLLLLFAMLLGLRQDGSMNDYKIDPFQYLSTFKPPSLQFARIDGQNNTPVRAI